MRRSLSALALAAFAVSAMRLNAQDYPPGEMKHLSVPTMTSTRAISVAALEIERGLHYPSVIHLKGKVEIRTPVCVATGEGTKQLCNGYTMVRADEADFHEDSGQIEARGHVTVTREK